LNARRNAVLESLLSTEVPQLASCLEGVRESERAIRGEVAELEKLIAASSTSDKSQWAHLAQNARQHVANEWVAFGTPLVVANTQDRPYEFHDPDSLFKL
jgi:c-di-GMP-related signal transduction protein